MFLQQQTDPTTLKQNVVEFGFSGFFQFTLLLLFLDLFVQEFLVYLRTARYKKIVIGRFSIMNHNTYRSFACGFFFIVSHECIHTNRSYNTLTDLPMSRMKHFAPWDLPQFSWIVHWKSVLFFPPRSAACAERLRPVSTPLWSRFETSASCQNLIYARTNVTRARVWA